MCKFPWSFAALVFLAVILTGCSDSFSPGPTTATSNVGTIQGKVFGGQQPVAQAHVFVMAVGVGGTNGNAGPGITASTTNKATSLIPSTATGATLDSTIGGYYVETNPGGDFTITGDYACTLNTQVYILALQGKPDGVNNNSAIGLMAVLGNCPNSGTLSVQVPTVIVNEISTIAAAYALAGFATDSWHISSDGTALAQVGVKNAAANASQLYSFTTPYPYTANATTASGGTVPRTLINSLANSLAACVNTTSSTSSNCTTLFGDAKSAGSSGTAPTDTATAAINIAHNPGANVTAIYNLGTGTPPFSGISPAPSDFSIGITYTGSLNNPYDVAIDGSGNAWVTSTNGDPGGNGSVTEFSPLGVPTVFPNTASNGIDQPLAVAIDQSGNAWITSYDLTKISGGVASKVTFPDDVNGAWYVAVDKSNDVWVSSYTDTKLYDLTQSGGEVTGSPYTYSNSATPEQLAIDSTGRIWSVYGNEAGLLELTNPGSSAVLTEFEQLGTPGVRANSGIAIDSSNDVWAVAQTTGTTNGITNECLAKWSPTSNTFIGCYDDTGMQGVGVAVDGASNVWVANGQITGGIGAVEFNDSGTLLSPAGGYSGGAQNYPNAIAVDGSGDVWLPGTGSGNGTTIVELIGIAVPVVTPISPIYPNGTTTGLGVRP